MPTSEYRISDGTRVPGVTTVISGLGWKTPGLISWAHKLGLAGQDYRKVRDDAADIGTLCHALVEAHIHEREFVVDGLPADQVAKAKVAFGGFLEWYENTKVRVIATEIKLISERHRFGGTPDWIALTQRGLSLPDVKSSTGIYADYLVQIAAYGQLWEEVTDMPLVGGYHICRFDKNSGGFSHKWLPREALADAWQLFLRLRDIYDMRKPLEALAK